MTKIVYGNKHSGWEGWKANTNRPSEELQKIEYNIKLEEQNAFKDTKKLGQLYKKRTKCINVINHIKNEIAVIERLIFDDRMRPAYALLHNEFSQEQQWKDFFRAASWAKGDFSEKRAETKKAQLLNDKIKTLSKELADCLVEINEIGNPAPLRVVFSSLNLPGEFYYIYENLKIVAHEKGHYQEQDWEELKYRILGNSYSTDTKVLQHRFYLDDAWRCAPPVSTLLYNIAEVSSKYVPQQDLQEAAVAIASQKPNEKIEYIRYIGAYLKRKNITITSGVMKAIATFAIVAVDNEEVDVSYDDVRKALKFLEHSPKVS